MCIKDRETITNSTNQVHNPSTNHIHYTLYNIQYIMAIAVSCINYWLSTHQWCMYLVFISDISHQCCMYLVFISDLIYQCCIFYNRLISATSAVPCILDLSQPPVLSLVFWIDLSHQCCLLYSGLISSTSVVSCILDWSQPPVLSLAFCTAAKFYIFPGPSKYLCKLEVCLRKTWNLSFKFTWRNLVSFSPYL